jgi:uncharacterized membrane protein
VRHVDDARHRDGQEENMKSTTAAGIILIVLGILALAYQGITYTSRKKVIDIGPLQATSKTDKTFPLPPVLGGLALMGGVALVIVGSKNK